MTYGDRLEQAMKKAKVSRKSLAEKLGISEQAVGQVVRGETIALDSTNHTKAFLFLNCDPLWLATGQYAPHQSRIHLVSEPAPQPFLWPFKRIDLSLVNALTPPEVLTLEGAWMLAARQIGFSIEKAPARDHEKSAAAAMNETKS